MNEQEREARLREWDQQMADYHRNSFVGCIIAPRVPETFTEGLLKGLMLGGVISSILLDRNFIEFNVATAIKVFRFYASISFATGGVGLLNDYQNNFRREGPRIGFFEGLPPATQLEGAQKGFVVGFTIIALLNFSKVWNVTNLSSFFLPMFASILGGALWGNYNERRAGPR